MCNVNVYFMIKGEDISKKEIDIKNKDRGSSLKKKPKQERTKRGS